MSITATLVPAGAGAWAAAAGGPACGRAPPGGRPCCAADSAARKQTDNGPATKVAHTRESLTLGTPCLVAGHPDRGAAMGGVSARRLPVAGIRPVGRAEGAVLCRGDADR